jgi:hypothetical protein
VLANLNIVHPRPSNLSLLLTHMPWIKDHILLFHGSPQVVKFEVWNFCTFKLKMAHWNKSICLSPHLTPVSLASLGGDVDGLGLVIFYFKFASVIFDTFQVLVCFDANMLVTFRDDCGCQYQMLHSCCKFFWAPPWLFSWYEHVWRCAVTNKNLLHFFFCCTSVCDFLWFLARF